MIHIKIIFSHILLFLQLFTYSAIFAHFHCFLRFGCRNLGIWESYLAASNMAKSSTVAKWLKSLNEKEDYPLKKLQGDQIFCKACEQSFGGSQKSQLEQHIKSAKHGTNCELKKKRTQTQAQLEDFVQGKVKKRSRAETLGKDLCQAFLAANIPWKKLENPCLRGI